MDKCLRAFQDDQREKKRKEKNIETWKKNMQVLTVRTSESELANA
jgi:hypothetical protein